MGRAKRKRLNAMARKRTGRKVRACIQLVSSARVLEAFNRYAYEVVRSGHVRPFSYVFASLILSSARDRRVHR